ncbi:MAG: hypothetical protein HY268_10480 [Deltaproteobacteria bacterium]|nr:hypothetical protein [Deltaproteobacteria bacterium]
MEILLAASREPHSLLREDDPPLRLVIHDMLAAGVHDYRFSCEREEGRFFH